MSGGWWQRSATEIAAAVGAGKASAREVLEDVLSRLAQVNGSVNAVTVVMADEARQAADAADRAMAAGAPPGPLHGVPVTIKENIDVAGGATTNGVVAFREVVARDDSPLVGSLRRAGAVIFGRTNTPAFSLRWHTDNALRGATMNPWDPTRVPGGSSGGAGAALACGIGPLAHGNDLGGSLRYPAYCCGIATIRPTLGRIPAYNATAPEERPPLVQLMSVQGPMAREVRDVRLALAVMSERDPRDPWWVPAPLAGPPSPPPLRVAVVVDPDGAGVDPAVAAAVRTAADTLARAGYAVEEASPPPVQEAADLWASLLMTDMRVAMADTLRAHGDPGAIRAFESYLALAPALTLEQYVRALAERARHLRAWLLFLERYPLVVGPVSTEPPLRVGDDLAGPERMRAIWRAHRLMTAVNLLGLPAAVVPTGLHGGVPLGVQIIGSRYREDLCLDAAETVERAAGVLTPIDPRAGAAC